jgi:hypothetical protein
MCSLIVQFWVSASIRKHQNRNGFSLVFCEDETKFCDERYVNTFWVRFGSRTGSWKQQWTLTAIRVCDWLAVSHENKMLYDVLSYIFVLRFSQTGICKFGSTYQSCSVAYVALAVFRVRRADNGCDVTCVNSSNGNAGWEHTATYVCYEVCMLTVSILSCPSLCCRMKECQNNFSTWRGLTLNIIYK